MGSVVDVATFVLGGARSLVLLARQKVLLLLLVVVQLALDLELLLARPFKVELLLSVCIFKQLMLRLVLLRAESGLLVVVGGSMLQLIGRVRVVACAAGDTAAA